MNKKTKWGIIILIGAGIIGGGIYSQLPKTNDELAAADKVKNTQKNGKKILNVNAKVIKPQLLTDEYTTTGVLLPDEEVDLSFETSGKVIEINFEEADLYPEHEGGTRSIRNRWQGCRTERTQTDFRTNGT